MIKDRLVKLGRFRIEIAVLLSASIEHLIAETLVAAVLISFLGTGFNMSLNRQTYRPVLIILWLTGFATLLHLARASTLLFGGALDSKFVMLIWIVLAPRITHHAGRRLTGRNGTGVVEYETSPIEMSTALGAIALILAPSYLRSGGMPTWVMSGDSRNHLLISRDVVDRGGFLWWDNYPSLFNSLTSLASGWRHHDSSLSSGELTSMIHVQAFIVALVLFLIIINITSVINHGVHIGIGVHERSSIAFTCRLVSGAVLSAIIATSNWFLRSVLEEGFFPVLFTLLIASMYVMILTEQRSLVSRMSISSCAVFLLLSTFPIAVLVPLIIGAFDMVITLLNRNEDRPPVYVHTISMILLISCVSAAWVLGHVNLVVNVIRRYLAAYGRISPLAVSTAVVLLSVVFLILAGRSRFPRETPAVTTSRMGQSIRLAYPVVTSLFVTFVSLNPAIGPSYYRDKSLLVIFCVSVVTFVVASSDRGESRELGAHTRSLIPIAAVATVVTFLPIQGQSGFRAPPTVDLAVGWQLPSDREAALIRQIDDQSPGSVPFNMTGDPLAQRVMAIWTTGALPSSGESVSWAYSADIFDLENACDFARRFGVSVVTSKDPQHSSVNRIC